MENPLTKESEDILTDIIIAGQWVSPKYFTMGASLEISDIIEGSASMMKVLIIVFQL